MTRISGDPQQLAEAGRRVAALHESLTALARRARAQADTPMNQHFPSVAEGQQLADHWRQGREHVADGLRLANQALAALAQGLQGAAAAFAAANASAHEAVNRPTPTVNLPL